MKKIIKYSTYKRISVSSSIDFCVEYFHISIEQMEFSTANNISNKMLIRNIEY